MNLLRSNSVIAPTAGTLPDSSAVSPHVPTRQERQLRARWMLLILLLAFGLRVIWLHSHALVIENEGAEYARIAQNLRSGNGYQGTMDGQQLLFPPLYPLLIAAFSFVVKDSELAGRVVSLLAGGLLVVPLMLLVSRHYGNTSGFVAGVLAACYPPLIALSTTTFSECLYTTLLISGIYAGLCCIELRGARYYILTGILFGLAYLTRPEALGYCLLVIIGVFLLAWRHHVRMKQPLLAALLILACVFFLAMPYLVYLHHYTGHWRLEGKSEVNYALGLRLNSGMSGDEAAFGLGAQGEEEGPLLNPNAWIGHTRYPRNPLQILHYLKASATDNFRVLTHSPLFALLWTPLLLLGALGLFRTVWDPARTEREFFVILMFAFAMLPVVVGPYFSQTRFILPLLPILLIWSSKGLLELADWTAGTVAAVVPSGHISKVAVRALPLLSGIVLVISSGVTLARAPLFQEQGEHSLGLRKAGLWLRNQQFDTKRIMSGGTVVPYYAGATWIPKPYAKPALMLDYAREAKADFVVLNDFGGPAPPEFQNLLTSSGADLIYDAGVYAKPRVLIYRLARQ